MLAAELFNKTLINGFFSKKYNVENVNLMKKLVFKKYFRHVALLRTLSVRKECKINSKFISAGCEGGGC